PIEQEGTYPLPEAQLDRFLVQVDVGYPDRATERDILIATTGAEEAQVHQVFTAEDLLAAQAVLRRMPVGDRVVGMILDLVRACRPQEPEGAALADVLSWGPGPRAAQALMLTVRARALLDGRLVPDADDVRALARPVMIHRMALTFAARARGESLGAVIDSVVARLTALEAAA
ncbi:MAG: MoxR family ATPase, partial [Rhodobacter sp.]|nr:MoxR family ATPase [Rhodobacter sp.]